MKTISKLLFLSIFALMMTFSYNDAYAQRKKAIKNNDKAKTTITKPVNTIKNPTKPKSSTPKPTAAAPKVSFDKNDFTLNYDNNEYQFVIVEGGKFTMGNDSINKNEAPAHNVLLETYAIGQTEVPLWLWKAVMGTTPTSQRESYNDYVPVADMTWQEASQFVDKLNKLTGQKFSLPTEAQWEFAARGGIYSDGYVYSGSNSLPEARTAHNELYIYNMSGSVREFCSDWYDEYSEDGARINPTGASRGIAKVVRGGSDASISDRCRITARESVTETTKSSDLGLRLVYNIVK